MAQDFWSEYYGSLNGARILKFDGMDVDAEDDEYGVGGDGFPTFTVQLLNGKVIQIQISQDPEGNGGGFIFGLKAPVSA